jgi:hypothetical protein
MPARGSKTGPQKHARRDSAGPSVQKSARLAKRERLD